MKKKAELVMEHSIPPPPDPNQLEHIPPILIKAGHTGLLINGHPPLVDCRLIAEEEYQLLLANSNVSIKGYL